ncbi:hypothetical protein AB833_21345 [Chromatiales bacterium (ex Bugula neritina AB1)]|nr:hypothetical protein AB833_21345 [Chromatiales bacterium (ex Bugula neritina AB1)]
MSGVSNAYVRNATADDIEGICSLLHTKMNPRIPLERWRNLMTYEWLEEKPDFGRVVEADGQVLGFCGMVYSDRLLGSVQAGLRSERMVSMSSWYLDRSLRGMGLGREMLASSIADPMMTYATLTNSPKPLAIQDGVGMRVLEDHRYVWRKTSGGGRPLEIVADPAIIRSRLARHEQVLLDDMASQPLMPYLLVAGGKETLLFFSIKRKAEHVTWYDLMYAGDLMHFSIHAPRLADTLLPDGIPSVLAADGRFVLELNGDAVREELPVPRLYSSQRVEPYEVDHLYSELQLLDQKLD